MIKTIQIGPLLRETVASPYRNLVTRPTGAAVRNRIQEALAASDCHTALLDFTGIELLDFSCADEIVAKLLLAVTGDCAGRFVVLQGLREDQHEAIEHVLTHHGLAIAVAAGPEHAPPRLLGWVTTDARAAFGCVCELGALSAVAAAAALGWSAGRAQEALEALAFQRLVRAEGGLFHPLSVA